MKGKLIWSLVVGAVAGTMFTVAAPVKADVLYVDTMPSSRIITSPVVVDTTPTYVVDTTPVVTAPIVTTPTITAPIMIESDRSHFLRFGLGPLLDFGLF
jgi:hypothetical protein